MFFAGLLQQRLRRQHVLDLGRADAERQRAQRAVRRGVAESPQTMVVPGRLMPSSGPMMWTMPWRTSRIGMYGTPNSATFFSSVSTWMRLSSSLMPARRSVVGCCGPPPRSSRPAGARCGRPSAAPRTPAGWSLRAADGGRCRGCTSRPGAARRRGCPRSCRTACAACWRTCVSPALLGGSGPLRRLRGGARARCCARFSAMRARLPERPRR